MKLLITGLNGTRVCLAEAARSAGHEVLGWDRTAVDPEDEAASARWFDACASDAVAEMGMGSASLALAFNRPWQVQPHADYRHDQRLVGGPTRLPPLSARLRPAASTPR